MSSSSVAQSSHINFNLRVVMYLILLSLRTMRMVNARSTLNQLFVMVPEITYVNSDARSI